MKKILALAMLLALSGCATYYRVVDSSTGKAYITDKSDMDRHLGGSLEFKDLKTGDEVTVQNTEVREISSAEAKAEIAK